MTGTELEGAAPQAKTLETAQQEIREGQIKSAIARAYDGLSHRAYQAKEVTKEGNVNPDDIPQVKNDGKLIAIGDVEANPVWMVESVMNAAVEEDGIRIEVPEIIHSATGQRTVYTAAKLAPYQGFHLLDTSIEAYRLSEEWFKGALDPYSRHPETSTELHPKAFFPVVVAHYTLRGNVTGSSQR